jgi:cytochrome b
VRIWDLPLRVFHWLLAVAFLTAWLTLDNRFLDLHVFAGYVMGALLLFRLSWGFIGGPYARFRAFAYGWPAVRAQLTALLAGHPRRYLGHNPTGAWAIYLLLGIGALVTVTGVWAFGGEEHHGPLAPGVDVPWEDLGRRAHAYLAWAMLGMVGLHLGGVTVESLLLRENLVAGMLNGCRQTAAPVPASRAHRSIGLLLGLGVVAAAGIYFQGYWTQSSEQPYRPFLGQALPDDPRWRQECGECHLAFHPTLLPARSWRRLMAEQNEHFGEVLALDPEAVAHLREFLTANAADSERSEPAWKIHRSTAPGEVPLRVTETAYWRRKHAHLDPGVWSDARVGRRHNCGACHLDAEEGTFEDAAMRLPR